MIYLIGWSISPLMLVSFSLISLPQCSKRGLWNKWKISWILLPMTFQMIPNWTPPSKQKLRYYLITRHCAPNVRKSFDKLIELQSHAPQVVTVGDHVPDHLADDEVEATPLGAPTVSTLGAAATVTYYKNTPDDFYWKIWLGLPNIPSVNYQMAVNGIDPRSHPLPKSILP